MVSVQRSLETRRLQNFTFACNFACTSIKSNSGSWETFTPSRTVQRRVDYFHDKYQNMIVIIVQKWCSGKEALLISPMLIWYFNTLRNIFLLVCVVIIIKCCLVLLNIILAFLFVFKTWKFVLIIWLMMFVSLF